MESRTGAAEVGLVAAGRARYGMGERRELANRLHSAAIRVLRGVRGADRHSGLGPARLSALSVIVFRDGITLGELAELEQVRPPTVTHIVRGLEELKLVRRAVDPLDRRIARLHATARGRRNFELARDRRVEVLREKLEDFGDPELRVLERAVEILSRVRR